MLNVVLDAATVQHTEDSINTLYQIITYALPLLTALGIAIAAAAYKISSAVRKNTKTIGNVAQASNGKLDTLQASVTALHARLNAQGVQQEGEPHATQSATTGTNGGSTAGTA